MAAAVASLATETASAVADSSAGAQTVVDAIAPAVSASEIGYFESLGLAQGWFWPTDFALHALEYVHVYTGWQWWATIVALGVASRLVVLPLTFKSFAMNMKLKVVKPIMSKLQAELKNAPNAAEKAVIQLRIRKLTKMYGISMPVIFGGALVQVPIAYGFFVAISKMAAVPVAGLTTEGALWFQNLAISDPYLGLSVLSAASMYAGFKMGGDMGNASTMSPTMRTVMTYVPPAMMMGMGLWYSAANVLFFVVTGFLSMCQTIFMKTALFRRLMGISDDLYMKSLVSDQAAAKTSISEQYKNMWNNAKEQAEEKASRRNAPAPRPVAAPVMPVRVKKIKRAAKRQT